MNTSEENIYSKEFIKDLFDNMSKSYNKVNFISSFGFSKRWRKQVVQNIKIPEKSLTYDFMTGMGELWPFILKNNPSTQLIAVDLSSGMLEYAKSNQKVYNQNSIEILQTDILNYSFSENSADCIFSAFGLKTLSTNQIELLANIIKNTLKKDGLFSFIEISVPESKILRPVYMYYLKTIIPLIGKLFLGNPDNYKMLGIYTEKFKNCRHLIDIFSDAGLEVYYCSFFMGCATGLYGKKL